MSVTIRKINAKAKDPVTGELKEFGLFGSDALEVIETKKQEAVTAVTEEKDDFLAAIQDKGEEYLESIEGKGETTLASIPNDYTELANEVNDLKGDLAQIVPGLSEEAKDALIACFEHVAWSGSDGQDYYNDLYEALYGPIVDQPDLSTGAWESGHMWAGDGSESTSNYGVINRTYYPVEPDTKYTWFQGFSSYKQGSTYGQTAIGEMNRYKICVYDSEKNFIECISNDSLYTTDIETVESRSFSFITPSEAAFIRVSCLRYPVGFFAQRTPADIYCVILVYGKTNDSEFVSSDMSNVEAAISVIRNGYNITLFAKTGVTGIQSLGETYQLGRCEFNINNGANAEGGPATSLKSRYTVVKNMLMQEGDVIFVNDLKVAIWAQKLTGGTIQHTTSWLTSGDTFTIGGA